MTPLKLLVEQPNYDINLLVEEQGPNKDRKMYFEGIYMRAGVPNKNMRIYEEAEMEKEVGRYTKDMIETGRAMGELLHPSCHTKNAQILTENGWQSIVDVKQGDKVLSLNTTTEQIELNVVKRKIDEPYKGVMYRLKGRNIDVTVTPNHRFLIKTRCKGYVYVTAEELYNEDKKYAHDYIPRRGNWNVDSDDYYTIKGVNVKNPNTYNVDVTKDININYKTFMGFMGLWLAEGWCSHTEKENNTVYIRQNQGIKADKIRQLLSQFPEEMKWNEIIKENSILFKLTDKRLADYLKPLGNCYTKYIPFELKQQSPELLEELIYWFSIGDGRMEFLENNDYSISNIFSVSKKLVEDLNECLIKSGGSGNIQEIITYADYWFADHFIKAENKVPLYQLTIAHSKGIYVDRRFLEIEKIEDFDDNVYCVETENTNFYCMENGKGFWSGNSVEINPERACHLITKIRKEGKEFYGKSKILETPMGQIVRTLMLDGCKLGVSSRALGKLEQKGEYNDVSEFRLITCDVVHDPSVDTAFVDGIYEAKQYVLKCDGVICEFVEKQYEKLDKCMCNLPKHSDERAQKMAGAINDLLAALKGM